MLGPELARSVALMDAQSTGSAPEYSPSEFPPVLVIADSDDGCRRAARSVESAGFRLAGCVGVDAALDRMDRQGVAGDCSAVPARDTAGARIAENRVQHRQLIDGGNLERQDGVGPTTTPSSLLDAPAFPAAWPVRVDPRQIARPR
jgi:hypothetical protein